MDDYQGREPFSKDKLEGEDSFSVRSLASTEQRNMKTNTDDTNYVKMGEQETDNGDKLNTASKHSTMSTKINDIIGHEEKNTGNDDFISHDNAMYTENRDLLKLAMYEANTAKIRHSGQSFKNLNVIVLTNGP